MAAAALAFADPDQLYDTAELAVGKARAAGGAIAHGFGLTEDEDYEGWLALAVIAYAELYPPLKAAWHIEQQVVGVLDQLYNFLGGVGHAIDGGVKSLEAAGNAVGGAVSYVFSGRWL